MPHGAPVGHGEGQRRASTGHRCYIGRRADEVVGPYREPGTSTGNRCVSVPPHTVRQAPKKAGLRDGFFVPPQRSGGVTQEPSLLNRLLKETKKERLHCLTGTVFVGHRNAAEVVHKNRPLWGTGKGGVVRPQKAGVTRGRFLSHTSVRTGGTKKPSPLSHLLKRRRRVSSL